MLAIRPPYLLSLGPAALAVLLRLRPRRAAMESYIGFCQETFGQPGAVEFKAGYNGLPMVTLRCRGRGTKKTLLDLFL